MDNMIKYFYNLEPNMLKQMNNNYHFMYQNEKYILHIFNRDIKTASIAYEYNQQLIKSNILLSEIILNKDKNTISIINNVPYCLIKIYINENKKINLTEVSYISSFITTEEKELQCEEWTKLWNKKIDYLEYQISETGKKHPIIVDSFSYFIGLAENANSYIKNTLIEEQPSTQDQKVISHRKIKIKDTITELYNPLNLIIDHPSRDIAEYIKYSFFNNNQNIFKELNEYFKYHYYSKFGIRLLFGRCLYPSFYFDLYDSILLEEEKEESIVNITKQIDKYEKYLLKVYNYLNKIYPLPKIMWLIKKED